MAKQKTNPDTTRQNKQTQHHTDDMNSTSFKELELAFADTLLDQIDEAQQQIRSIQSDIALLQTMENALCLISENMSKIRRLAQEMLDNSNATEELKNLASDAIRNLMMVNMLITEDTEFNGHLLFKDDIISMSSSDIGDLTLETTNIPDIHGVEDGDFQAILDSLDSVARIINRQYQRINTMMLTLLNTYRQVRSEIDILRKASPQQSDEE